jgi:hypothetical protein
VNADRVRELLLFPVSVCIMVAWMAALADALLYNRYTPLTAVMPVMLVFVGFLFGSNIVKRLTRDQ